jgi:hypothetical protein
VFRDFPKGNDLLLNRSRQVLSCLTLGTGLEKKKCTKEARENEKGMIEEVHE